MDMGFSLFSGDAEERHCSHVIDNNRPRPNTKTPSPRKPQPSNKARSRKLFVVVQLAVEVFWVSWPIRKGFSASLAINKQM